MTENRESSRRSVAIIETGGKQHLVREGDIVTVEKLTGEPEEKVDFTDLLAGKKVHAVILAHSRAPKIQVRKFKSKVRYLRRRGHRQPETRIRIEKID